MLKKTDQSIIQSYFEDNSNLKGGFAEGVYLPENETEIVEILKECSSKKIPLTVSGGTTGTTGGCIPFGGWVLSTENLNKIITVDEKEMFAVLQPGVTLEDIGPSASLDRARDKSLGVNSGLIYPPDPTETTAFIGGTVATNASGARSFRFGSTRNWIKRLKVVLSTGEILDIKRGQNIDASRIGSTSLATSPHYALPNVKTSAGYFSKSNMDLIDLFIGSEGTLGVVTEIEIGLIPELPETFDILAFFGTEEKAVSFVEEARREKDVLVLEFFDNNSLELLRTEYPKIPSDAKSSIYIEAQILDKWAPILEKYGVKLEETWMGKNELREFRHSMPEHINEEFKKHNTVKFASDIAVPDDKFKEMLAFYNSHLASRSTHLFYVKFGHIGQNHLHVNLVPRTLEDIPLAKELIMSFVKKAVSLGGTCSAEHGIGKIKYPYLREMFGDKGIAEMVRIKKLFDPACVLNQGNLFPKDLLALNSKS